MLSTNGESNAVKKGGSNKSIIGVLLAVIGVIVVGIVVALIIMLNPIRQYVSAYSRGQYTKAISVYQEKIKGNKNNEGKAKEKLETELKRIKDGFIAEDIEYDKSIKMIEVIQKSNLLPEEVKDVKLYILNLHNSREAYEAGTKALDGKDYQEATYQLQKVIKEDEDYDDAQDKLKTATEKYTEYALSESQKLVDEGKNIEALKVLREATKLLPDVTSLSERQNEVHKLAYPDVAE